MWGADYILWMDSDHVFPAESLCRLWARNVDIVGVNYSRRCSPTAPTAARFVTDDPDQDTDNLVYTDRKSDVSGKSVSVRVDLGGRRIIKKKEAELQRSRIAKKNT